jgi:protein ImuB
MKKLYACVCVCDFPVAVWFRERWNRPAQPALVFSGTASNAFVYAANAAARSLGIRKGMPLSQAEGRFLSEGASIGKGKLLIQPRDKEAEQQAQRELLQAALKVCPWVENSGPGLLVLDLAGLPDPHAAAAALADRVERLGFPANVAVSQNRFVAVSAAQTQKGITHIFPHEVQGFLHSLPIEVLPLSEQEQKTVDLWGIRTVGEFARLPQDSLAARFGQRGASLAKLARGEEDVVFEAWQEPYVFEESLEFDWQICELDPLSFPLVELLQRLCEGLQCHGLAAEAVRVSLKLPDGSHYERTLSLSQPLTNAEALLKLIRLELAAHPSPDAVEGLTLTAKPVPQRVTQYSFFAPPRPGPAKLAVTLTRLKNLVGPTNVGTPAVCDTHRPRAF